MFQTCDGSRLEHSAFLFLDLFRISDFEFGVLPSVSRIELRLPDLGLEDQPMSLSSWLVSRSARVEEGEPVAEILAGPVTVDLPASAAGVLVKRLVNVDAPLSVGQVLAVIETEPE